MVYNVHHVIYIILSDTVTHNSSTNQHVVSIIPDNSLCLFTYNPLNLQPIINPSTKYTFDLTGVGFSLIVINSEQQTISAITSNYINPNPITVQVQTPISLSSGDLSLIQLSTIANSDSIIKDLMIQQLGGITVTKNGNEYYIAALSNSDITHFPYIYFAVYSFNTTTTSALLSGLQYIGITSVQVSVNSVSNYANYAPYPVFQLHADGIHLNYADTGVVIVFDLVQSNLNNPSGLFVSGPLPFITRTSI